MSLPVQFMTSNLWNTGSSGAVGGALTSTGVGTSLDDVFPRGVSDFIGQPDRDHFQKIYIENTGGTTISNAKVYFSNLEIPEQILMAFEATSGDTGTDPNILPTGYNSGDFSTPQGIINATGVPGGNLEHGTGIGVWIWQKISPDLPTETGVVATLGMVGEV